jgi:hypothetical protein
MIYSERRNRIVDYLGTHQHLAVDIDVSIDENTRGLRLVSGEQRFYEGFAGFRFPMLFSGIADVCEWYDDETAKYQIEVNVTNKTWGPLFGYRGSFDVSWFRGDEAQPPKHVLPVREERRE